jgi:ADP-ribose pyrophosphatase YjhB (NUDIX family)
MTPDDQTGAGDRWIPQRDYDLILGHVPILCVDLISLSEGVPPKVGLIERDTYAGGKGWCLVGGAVLRDEPLTTAVVRHLKATLGDRIEVDPDSLKLFGIVQYFTDPGIGRFYDPRKHAVSLTYTGRCRGDAQVQQSGEAHDFAWFSPGELDQLSYGFGQGELVTSYLRDGSREGDCFFLPHQF